MDLIETIGQLVEYGLAFAVLAGVVGAFLTDNLVSGKARDREINRERELTDKAVAQVDGLTDAIKQMSDAFERSLKDLAQALERQADIELARQQERQSLLKER